MKKKSKNYYSGGSNKEWCKVLENIDKEVECDIFPEEDFSKHCPHRLPCGVCVLTNKVCPIKEKYSDYDWIPGSYFERIY